MLAKANRVVRAEDFRTAVRGGTRVVTPHAIIYLFCRPDQQPLRFGFIVSSTVGNAVVRNRVRRRLRSIGRETLGTSPGGGDIVIRALPGVAEVSWDLLHDQIVTGVEKGLRKCGIRQ